MLLNILKITGTKALKLKQNDSEVMYAEPNEVSVEMGYRRKSDVAAGVMMHVGGIYNLRGEEHYGSLRRMLWNNE